MCARLHRIAGALAAAGRFAVREVTMLTTAYVGGVAAVAVGAGLIYPPAGFITGGTLSATSAVLYARGASRKAAAQ